MVSSVGSLYGRTGNETQVTAYPDGDDLAGLGGLFCAPVVIAHASRPAAARTDLNAACSSDGGTGRTGDEFETGVILVKFKTEVSEEGISSALDKFSAQITGQIPALGVLRLSVPEGREIELSEQLSQDPAVEYAEPDYVVHAF